MWLLIVLALIALQPFPLLVQTHEKTPERTAAHNVEAELEKLDEDAEEAARRGDASFFEKFLSDDLYGGWRDRPHEHEGSNGGVCPVWGTQIRNLEN